MDENNTSQTPASGKSAARVGVIVAVIVLVGIFIYFQNQKTTPTASPESGASVAGESTESDESMPSSMEETANKEESMKDEAMAGEGMGNVKEITVYGSSFKFEPSEIKVKKGDTVKVTFINSGGFHDWVLDEFNVRTKQISSGAQETVEFVADKTGSFEYYCSVGQHRQMGMKGTLVVE